MSVSQALPGLAIHALLHLLAVGTLVRLAVAVALRTKLIGRLEAGRPRARYLAAITAFAAAILLALGLQSFGLATGQGSRLVDYDEASVTEAFWMLGRSAQWPLLQQADNDFQAWWLWFSIGPGSRDLVLIWVIGILALTAWSAFGWLRFQKQRRRWYEAPGALRRSLDFPDDVGLFTGPVGTPLATGIWQGVVYLPRWAITELDSTALARIARHELAHVRWRDPLVDRLVRLLRGLFWPAWPLWSLARLIRREREAAADRQALAFAEPEREPRQAVIDYAETLMRVAARRSGLVPLVGASGELEDRVQRLLKPSGRVSFPARIVPALLLLTGCAALVSNPLPPGAVATAPFAENGEDVRRWGPLDHFLGFNPIVEVVVAPGEHRIRIQGWELDAEQMERWNQATTLAERAAMVLEAEELARRASPTD